MEKFITDKERQQIAEWDKYLLVTKVNQLAERVAALEKACCKSKPPAEPKTTMSKKVTAPK